MQQPPTGTGSRDSSPVRAQDPGRATEAEAELATLLAQVCRAHPRRLQGFLGPLEHSLVELADSPIAAPLKEALAAIGTVRVEPPKRRLWSGPNRTAQAVRDTARDVTAFEASIAHVIDGLLAFARQSALFQMQTKTAILGLKLEVRELMRCHRRADALAHPRSGPAASTEGQSLELVDRLEEQLDNLLRDCAELEVARELFPHQSRRSLTVAVGAFSDECDLLLSEIRRTGAGSPTASHAARAELQTCLDGILSDDRDLRCRAERALQKARSVSQLCRDLCT